MSNIRKINSSSNIIGKNLKKYRKLNNFSQEDLCRELQLLGITMYHTDIYAIEHNKRLVKDFELKAFCIVFKISSEDLLSGTEQYFC